MPSKRAQSHRASAFPILTFARVRAQAMTPDRMMNMGESRPGDFTLQASARAQHDGRERQRIDVHAQARSVRARSGKRGVCKPPAQARVQM